MQGGSIRATPAELARRKERAARFAAEAAAAHTTFAPPPKTFAHPDSVVRVDGDVRGALLAAAGARLAAGDALTDAQRSKLAQLGLSEACQLQTTFLQFTHTPL